MNIWDLDDHDLIRAAKHLKEENRRFTDRMQRIPCLAGNDPRLPLEAWRSRHFLCQVFSVEEKNVLRLSVNRTIIDTTNRRWRDGISWEELQEVKRQVGRGHCDAVEMFPADEDVVNVANIRHLFVFDGKSPFSFVWRKKK